MNVQPFQKELFLSLPLHLSSFKAGEVSIQRWKLCVPLLKPRHCSVGADGFLVFSWGNWMEAQSCAHSTTWCQVGDLWDCCPTAMCSSCSKEVSVKLWFSTIRLHQNQLWNLNKIHTCPVLSHDPGVDPNYHYFYKKLPGDSEVHWRLRATKS